MEMQDAIVMRIDNHVRYVTMAKKSLSKMEEKMSTVVWDI